MSKWNFADLLILFIVGTVLGLFVPYHIILLLLGLVLWLLVVMPILLEIRISRRVWQRTLSIGVAIILVQIPSVSTFIRSYSNFIFPRQ